MSGPRRRTYSRLLRWYPRAWREEHGQLMLDTLEEHADGRGIARPSSPEAWSIRAHGLGERATTGWAALAAAVSLAAYVFATSIVLSNAIMLPGAATVRIGLAVFLGPLALALSIAVLLQRRGLLSATTALWAAAGAVPACALAMVAAASFSVGFDEADGGAARSWFGSATLQFLGLAWLAGTIALLPPIAFVVKKKHPVPIRWLLAVMLAAFMAGVLGMLMLAGQMMGDLAAAALLVVAAVEGRPAWQAAGRGKSLPAEPSRSLRPRSVTSRGYASAAAAALFSLVVGIGCAAVALTGNSWTPGVNDSTHAMNLGLAAGALAAIPVAIAAGMLLTPRCGRVMRWSALLLCTGLALEAAAQLAGAGHALQWPMTLAAAVLLGFAMALPVGGMITSKRSLRLGLTVMLGLAGSYVGLTVVAAAGFIAPLAAAFLLAWTLKRLSAGPRQAGPHMAWPRWRATRPE